MLGAFISCDFGDDGSDDDVDDDDGNGGSCTRWMMATSVS